MLTLKTYLKAHHKCAHVSGLEAISVVAISTTNERSVKEVYRVIMYVQVDEGDQCTSFSLYLMAYK